MGLGDKTAQVFRILVIDQVAAQVSRAAPCAQVTVVEARADAAVGLNVKVDSGFLAGRNGPVIEDVDLGSFLIGPAEPGEEKAGLALTLDRELDLREIENRHILDVKNDIASGSVSLHIGFQIVCAIIGINLARKVIKVG